MSYFGVLMVVMPQHSDGTRVIEDFSVVFSHCENSKYAEITAKEVVAYSTTVVCDFHLCLQP